MRTYNKGNTQNVKQARKQSKELRKLKMGRNTTTFIEINESVKCQQNSYYYEDDFVYEGDWWWINCFVSLVTAHGLSQNEKLHIPITVGFTALIVVVVILKL